MDIRGMTEPTLQNFRKYLRNGHGDYYELMFEQFLNFIAENRAKAGLDDDQDKGVGSEA